MGAKNLHSDINFLYEMGNIRFIERMWRRFLHDDFANLAEHHFRVFWIAMVIAANEGNVDTGKIAKLCLLHDIAESRTGDVDYLSRQYVDRKEEMAIHDMLEGTSVADEFLALWEEYEKRETLEAQIAKDADNLDVDFELAEQAAKGSQLQEVKHPTREVVAETKLYTDTAKELYRQLKSSNPHDWWWFSARNRGNGGDWKK
jgi:putative hydrolase of HD superfamily